MEKARYAAIDLDEVIGRPLGELSAIEFLQVLSHPKMGFSEVSILADKKKYELWVEEGPIAKLPIGEILAKLRGEKKKVEYELPPWIRHFEEDGLRQLDYARLAEEVAERVTAQLGR
jgi:hypothetical protein